MPAAGGVWLFGRRYVFVRRYESRGRRNDPMCRRKPFPWDERKQDGDLLALYRRMAKLRQRGLALCVVADAGALYAEGDVVVFVRVYRRQQRALVAVLTRGGACESGAGSVAVAERCG